MIAPTDQHNFEDRFWSKVNKTNNCWLWTGSTNGVGYGEMRINGKKEYAHRLSYKARFESIPKGFDIDHLCRVPACVNPNHLEAVTHKENVRRGNASEPKGNLIREICKNGHEAKIAGIYIRPDGVNACRQCLRDNSARYRARKD